MARKTSLKESTRRKGQLRIDQQAALKKQQALAKKKKVAGAGMTEKEGRALERAAAAKPKAKAKKKRVNTVGGLAGLLRSRGNLPK
jgi:hypothetical protein